MKALAGTRPVYSTRAFEIKSLALSQVQKPWLFKGQPVALVINWKLPGLELLFMLPRVIEHETESN